MQLTARDIAAAADKVEFVIKSFAAPAIKDTRDRRLESWRSSLTQVRNLLADTAKVQIAMVGTTGAGKSTLLNAVLEHELLPTGVVSSCTAFVTTVASHPYSHWELKIQYLSREGWEREQAVMLEALRESGETETPRERIESASMVKLAKRTLSSVYGLNHDAITPEFDPRKQTLPVEVARALENTNADSAKFDSFRDLQARLKQLVQVGSHLWPIIEKVSVTGPVTHVPAGLELVDLPGTNDRNWVRVEATREFLTTAPHIWLVAGMKRGLTNDIQAILQETGLLRKLVLRGRYEALALVGTHADEIDSPSHVGLHDEATFSEIYTEYRRQFSEKAREQIVEMVEEMRQPDDNVETANRLVSIAKRIPVLTTSAHAYLRLKQIVRGTRPVEVADIAATGIHDVQQMLNTIAESGGPAARLREARDRLGFLCDELEFFFRSPGSSASTAQRQQARAELDRALEAFGAAVKTIHAHAQSQYSGYREAFLQSLKTLVPEAKKGVSRSTDHWGGIHHMTLKAIVKRNGCFVSPSTGRDHDFNDDISSPLLNLLPVKWEHFFNDQIDRVVGDASTKLEAQSQALAAQIALILRFGKGDDAEDSAAEHLKWFHTKMDFLRDKCREVLAKQIRERRGKLTGDVYNTAQGQMQPAYRDTKDESGTGMKARILNRVQSHALHISSPLHESIETDLTKGLGEVWLQLEINLQRLFEEVRDKAQQIGANATTDLQSGLSTKTFTEALDSLDIVKASLSHTHKSLG